MGIVPRFYETSRTDCRGRRPRRPVVFVESNGKRIVGANWVRPRFHKNAVAMRAPAIYEISRIIVGGSHLKAASAGERELAAAAAIVTAAIVVAAAVVVAATVVAAPAAVVSASAAADQEKDDNDNPAEIISAKTVHRREPPLFDVSYTMRRPSNVLHPVCKRDSLKKGCPRKTSDYALSSMYFTMSPTVLMFST